MKRTTLSLLIVAMFSGLGTSALAADSPATSSQDRNERGTAAPLDKDGVKSPTGTSHREARAKCDSLKDDARRACQTDANTAGSQLTVAGNATSPEVDAMNPGAKEDGARKQPGAAGTDTQKAAGGDAVPVPMSKEDEANVRRYREAGATVQPRGAAPGQTTTAKPGEGSRAEQKGAADDTVQARARNQYMKAKAVCETLQGDAMRTCMTEAKTARTAAMAQGGTPATGQDQGAASGVDAVPRQPGTTGKTADQQPGGGDAAGKSRGNSQQVGGSPDTDPTASKPGVTGQTKSDAPTGSDDAASSKADYAAAQANARTAYKEAQSKCADLQAGAAAECVTRAKTVLADALAAAKTQWDERRVNKRKSAPVERNTIEGDGSMRGGTENSASPRRSVQ